MAMLEDMQMGNRVVWDLVQETLKARGFLNLAMQWAWWCPRSSSHFFLII